MSALKDAKVLVVEEISNNLKESQALYVINYATLDVVSFQEIRKELAPNNALLKVYKNRQVKQALKNTEYANINDSLVLQNAYAFVKGDSLAALKTLVGLKKKFPALRIVSGIYENKVVDEKTLDEISKLPSFTESLMILGNSLLSPLKQLSIGLNELIKQGKISE
uniref:Large ribosomal subunit protein uL10 n=1 Tax=Metamycoplasma hominis TaxID=2098 RepID=Q8GPL7_METHO|nr:50S ribosomal protein L10 [Metamycoplasma hominis ATCC 23114]